MFLNLVDGVENNFNACEELYFPGVMLKEKDLVLLASKFPNVKSLVNPRGMFDRMAEKRGFSMFKKVITVMYITSKHAVGLIKLGESFPILLKSLHSLESLESFHFEKSHFTRYTPEYSIGCNTSSIENIIKILPKLQSLKKIYLGVLNRSNLKRNIAESTCSMFVFMALLGERLTNFQSRVFRLIWLL